ncbi:PREDICTED: larval cuticle protein 16/17 [Drosophila arizonae]|uniref:Larval cuticle protein 16/17 n=1 Tax=Drosophila arizonae TaxID=7263 RepID=A0ABM1PD79_DROAR|nr:PREDICTED: larval cuticle protein 16/17 [Drosophila arizonae]
MFRLCLLLALCCTGGWGIEAEQQLKLVPIIKSLAEQKNDGSYFFAYEGADGSYREEVGIVRRSKNHMRSADDEDVHSAVAAAAAVAEDNNNADDDDDTELEVSGVYSYIDSDGKQVEVSYVADKNGFVPVGTNIPKEISDAARNAVQSLEVRAGKRS